VLLNRQRDRLEIDLLDDQGQAAIAAQRAAAAGAAVQGVLEELADLFGGEGGAVVLGMPGLSAP